MENNWKAATASRIGRAVHQARKGRYTAEQLSGRCADLGHAIHRTTITKIENGRGSFEVSDLLILAAALGIPPVSLLFPDIPSGQVEAIPGWVVPSSEAMNWFDGDGALTRSRRSSSGQTVIESTEVDYEARELLDAVKRSQRLEQARFVVITSGPADDLGQESNRRIIKQIDAELAQARQRIRELGGTLDAS